MLYAPPCLQRNLGILGSQSHSREWSHRFSAPRFPGQSLPHPADGAGRSRLWLTPKPPHSRVLKGRPGLLGTARGLGTKRFLASLRAAHLTSEDVTVPLPHPRPSDPYSLDPGWSRTLGPAQISMQVCKWRHSGRHCQAPRSSRLSGWVATQHPEMALEAPSGRRTASSELNGFSWAGGVSLEEGCSSSSGTRPGRWAALQPGAALEPESSDRKDAWTRDRA